MDVRLRRILPPTVYAAIIGARLVEMIRDVATDIYDKSPLLSSAELFMLILQWLLMIGFVLSFSVAIYTALYYGIKRRNINIMLDEEFGRLKLVRWSFWLAAVCLVGALVMVVILNAYYPNVPL